MKKVLSFLAIGAVVATGALVACDVGTATDEAVITSITVRAADVTRGLGCGERDGQVYKYVVVAKDTDLGRVVGAKVAECYADATFVDPPIARDVAYTLDVYLYDRAGFVATPDPLAAGSPGAFGTLTCTVTALFQVQAFSSCGEARATNVPATPDASLTDASDAGSDAASPDASDAGDAASSDAGDATSPDAGD